MTYKLHYQIEYDSPRYGRRITVRKNFESDGATGAMDIWTEAWWIHDRICAWPFWDDETPITALEAARILGDVLKRDGYPWRAHYWTWFTFLFGCKRARKNGWT